MFMFYFTTVNRVADAYSLKFKIIKEDWPSFDSRVYLYFQSKLHGNRLWRIRSVAFSELLVIIFYGSANTRTSQSVLEKLNWY